MTVRRLIARLLRGAAGLFDPPHVVVVQLPAALPSLREAEAEPMPVPQPAPQAALVAELVQQLGHMRLSDHLRRALRRNAAQDTFIA